MAYRRSTAAVLLLVNLFLAGFAACTDAHPAHSMLHGGPLLPNVCMLLLHLLTHDLLLPVVDTHVHR
jgi:hypothetical protein